MAADFPNQENHGGNRYGRVRTPAELGNLTRFHRKSAGLTLAEISAGAHLGLRFLSEFERGKENASLGRVLKALRALGLEMLVVPREDAERILRDRMRTGGQQERPR